MGDRLQKRFVDDVKGGDDKDKNEGTIEDLIQWLRTLKFFEKTSVKESDVRDAYGELAKSTKVVVLNFLQFLTLLDEIAKKNHIEMEKIKERLIKLVEENEKSEEIFKEKFKQGEVTIKEILENLERNPKIIKLRDQLKISMEDFEKTIVGMKGKASSHITLEEFLKNRDEIQRKLLAAATANVPPAEIRRIITMLEEIVAAMPSQPPAQSDGSGSAGTSKKK